MSLPRDIPGIDVIEYLVIDDGSSDDTSGVARRYGVHHIIRHRRNRGLAAAFQTGINTALSAGADIIVNTDADGQYEAQDIPLLVQPILEGRADIVVGDRQVGDNRHFGPIKRKLQVIGSALVRKLSSTPVTDAVSGFRAISRQAAQRTYIVSSFSYTTEMLIQAGRKRLAVVIGSHPHQRGQPAVAAVQEHSAIHHEFRRDDPARLRDVQPAACLRCARPAGHDHRTAADCAVPFPLFHR